MAIIAWPLLHGYDIIKLVIGRLWMIYADTRDYSMALDESKCSISLISVLMAIIQPRPFIITRGMADGDNGW